MISRRGLLSGLGALLAAPAIVRVASLMPVKAFVASDFRMNTWSGITWIDAEYDQIMSEVLTWARAECRRVTGIDDLGWAAAVR